MATDMKGCEPGDFFFPNVAGTWIRTISTLTTWQGYSGGMQAKVGSTGFSMPSVAQPCTVSSAGCLIIGEAVESFLQYTQLDRQSIDIVHTRARTQTHSQSH